MESNFNIFYSYRTFDQKLLILYWYVINLISLRLEETADIIGLVGNFLDILSTCWKMANMLYKNNLGVVDIYSKRFLYVGCTKGWCQKILYWSFLECFRALYNEMISVYVKKKITCTDVFSKFWCFSSFFWNVRQIRCSTFDNSKDHWYWQIYSHLNNNQSKTSFLQHQAGAGTFDETSSTKFDSKITINHQQFLIIRSSFHCGNIAQAVYIHILQQMQSL